MMVSLPQRATRGRGYTQGLEGVSLWWTLPGPQEDPRALCLLTTWGLSCHSVSQPSWEAENGGWEGHRRLVTVSQQATQVAEAKPATGGPKGCPCLAQGPPYHACSPPAWGTTGARAGGGTCTQISPHGRLLEHIWTAGLGPNRYGGSHASLSSHRAPAHETPQASTHTGNGTGICLPVASCLRKETPALHSPFQPVNIMPKDLHWKDLSSRTAGWPSVLPQRKVWHLVSAQRGWGAGR